MNHQGSAPSPSPAHEASAWISLGKLKNTLLGGSEAQPAPVQQPQSTPVDPYMNFAKKAPTLPYK